MTRSEIFTKAHQIAKSTVSVVGHYAIALSLALKEVYQGMKKVIETTEEKLINLGLSVWEKGNIRRIYINLHNHEALAAVFNFEYDTYKTGNLKWVSLNDEKISNTKGYKFVSQDTYFDCVANKFFGPLSGYEII